MANAYAPTYSALISEIQDITENTNSEFVARIPNFIQRGQDQVQRDLGLELWSAYYLDNLTTAGTYLRQVDWLMIRSIFLTASAVFLDKRHVDWVRMYASGTAAKPKYWAEDVLNPSDDKNSQILLGPTPDQTYAARFQIYQRLAALVISTHEENWITRNAGDLLLLQALINAHTYLVNPESAQTCMSVYTALMGAAQVELRGLERSGYTPIRVAARPGGVGAQ